MIFGTAGHIDHGKTALIKAITGVDADRLKEEKARGITIDLGFAYWPQADGSTIGFVDVPGHERFVSTMMAGAQGVEAALLVVAADDGVMPQTREHVELLALLGVSRGLVALTKADKVDEARLAAVEAEIAALLAPTPLAGSPVYPVSSLTGQGVEALKSALVERHQSHQPRMATRLFRLAVDRAFVLAGAGVVVTGTVLDGVVKVGDRVLVSPSGLEARVRAIHAQNRKSDEGRAGDRCALNLVGEKIEREAIKRGDMILAPEAHAPTRRIDAEVRVAPGAKKGLLQWMPARLHHATAETGCRIVLLEDKAPQAGDLARVQLVLDQPIAAFSGDRFVLRDPSESFTLAGGHLLDLAPPERKRRTPERSGVLDALENADDAAALAALMAVSAAPVSLTAFARMRGLSRAQALPLAGDALLLDDEFLLTVTREAALLAELKAALGAFHADNPDMPGQGLERLRMAIAPRIPAPLFRLLLRRFAARGDVAFEGNFLRLASHKVELSLEDENLWYEIRPRLDAAERFRPPRVRDIANALQEDEAAIRRLLRHCARAGQADEFALDHFLLRHATREAVRLAGELEAAGGPFNAGAFRDALEAASGSAVGRKVAIQILEFFDRHGVTIRRADLRRMNPHRRMLFEPVAPEGEAANNINSGRESSPVGRPDFKSGWGREPVPGGFDSHSLPPSILGG